MAASQSGHSSTGYGGWKTALLHFCSQSWSPFVPLIAGGSLSASYLILRSVRRDPSITAAARLSAAKKAMHAFAISSGVNGTCVGAVAGVFYIAGVNNARELRETLLGLNSSIRNSLKPN